MIIFGLLWVFIAPLSLVIIMVLLAFIFRCLRVRWAVPLAMLAVILPAGIIYGYDRANFISVCEGDVKTVIYHKATTEGIFLNSPTANSFGLRYLYDDGFSWVEAPNVYKRGQFVRYEHDTNSSNKLAVITKEIPTITARYEVAEIFVQRFGHTSITQVTITDRETGVLMAKSGSANFSGGHLLWLLGAWGTKSCPSGMSSPDEFNAFYHLAKNALR